MIGEIVQHILNRDFYLEYRYSDGQEGVHSFKVWRLYKGHAAQVSFAISDLEVRYAHKEILIAETNRYLEQVINALTQHRLIEEALS